MELDTTNCTDALLYLSFHQNLIFNAIDAVSSFSCGIGHGSEYRNFKVLFWKLEIAVL